MRGLGCGAPATPIHSSLNRSTEREPRVHRILAHSCPKAFGRERLLSRVIQSEACRTLSVHPSARLTAHVNFALSFSPMTPRRTLVKLPNLLSISRLVLAAGFVATGGSDARVGLIGAAAATDFLDGWLARRVDATSRWGALLDPIADRVFVLTVVGTFLFTGMLSTGAYFILLMRDLATAIGFLVARVIPWLRTVKFVARMPGKVVTVLQLFTLAAVLVFPRAVPVLLGAVAAASLVAIGDYTLALWRARAR